MSFSNFLEVELLDHVFLRDAGYTQPSGLYVALSSTDPTEDGSGMTEPSSGGYARVNYEDWGRTDSEVSNNGDITFPTSTGAWLSGTELTHFAIFDASTGGNMLTYGSVSPSQAVTKTNQTVLFKAGELKVSID